MATLDNLYLYKTDKCGRIRLFAYSNVATKKVPYEPDIWYAYVNNTYVSLKYEEGEVFKNRMWLRARDDERAKKIFGENWMAKAQTYAKAAANAIFNAENVEVVDDADYTKIHKVGD